MAEKKTHGRTNDAFKFSATALGAIISATAMFGGVAYAQDQAAAEEDEIVVTGSLFRNRNVVAASPIVTTGAEEVQESGVVTLESVLNQMPAFAPAGTAGTGGQGAGGRATLNLHGLGSNRNLVLLNGRRMPLADIAGNVDINTIPGAIISSVETITGGASAVYGSDAMSGVVNFRTLSDFEGLRADVQYGDSWQQDLQTLNASLSMGTRFNDDRGHALVSFGYTDREPLSGAQRDFFDFVTPSSFIGQGTFVPSATNLPDQTALNNLFASYGVAGPVANTLNLGFNDNGTLFTQTGARNYLGPTTGAFAIIGGNVRMPVGPQSQIQNGLNRRSMFASFDYELTPWATLYGQGFHVDTTVNTESGGSLTQFGTLTTIPVTNPFIPDDLADLLATRPTPGAAFTWNGRYVGLPDKSWDEQYTTQQALLGVRGDLPFEGWSYDFYSSYDTTDHNQSNYNAVLKNRVQTLLNAADGGDSICDGGFNPFGLANSSNISAECRAYMTTTAHSTEALSQHIAQFDVQGPIFELPAGEVNLAPLDRANWPGRG